MRDASKEMELGAAPGIILLLLDVTKPGEIARVAYDALGNGSVDVLFNNAGYGLAGPFEGATDQQIVAEINTNLLRVMRVTQAFLLAMRARRDHHYNHVNRRSGGFPVQLRVPRNQVGVGGVE